MYVSKMYVTDIVYNTYIIHIIYLHIHTNILK